MIGSECCLLLALWLHGSFIAPKQYQQMLSANERVATVLHLTDLALWTEARYTRHPSQTDFFSPFQDFPAAIEHFPAGSILAPSVLRANHQP